MNARAELQYSLPTSNAWISIVDCKYWFEESTVIDGKEYIKVYRQYCYTETDCGEKEYYAAVRQDNINEKIYCVFADDSTERLLADFDVEAGDEVTVYSFEQGQERLIRILDVDAILIDGQYRKRVSIKSDYSFEPIPYDFWVEGIGSVVFGLFFPAPELIIDACDYSQFLCLYVNDKLIYQNPDVNFCYRELQQCGGYDGCVSDCVKLGGTDNNCQFYCAPLFDDKFRAFKSCITNCTDEGGEFGTCLSHCREEYDNTNVPENLYQTFNISLSPTKDYLLVETELSPCSYVIYNALGATVKQGNLFSSGINISAFSQGVYYVVFYHNKQIYVHKFIK